MIVIKIGFNDKDKDGYMEKIVFIEIDVAKFFVKLLI